jgi:hypothetical protein
MCVFVGTGIVYHSDKFYTQTQPYQTCLSSFSCGSNRQSNSPSPYFLRFPKTLPCFSLYLTEGRAGTTGNSQRSERSVSFTSVTNVVPPTSQYNRLSSSSSSSSFSSFLLHPLYFKGSTNGLPCLNLGKVLPITGHEGPEGE